VAAARAELRRVCARRGRPGAGRVDHGGPRGSAGGLPPDLALWLIGLGVAVHRNDPHSPEQNGVAERPRGTGRRWAEPDQCDTPAELQRRLRALGAVRRGAYPSIGGRPRSAAFPELRHSGRAHTRAREGRRWSHRRAPEHWAGCAVVRRADQNGDVWLYHRPHYVGSLHRGKHVHAMVDPVRVPWVFTDGRGQQLRAQPADALAAQRIRRLTVANRR
jgi:hypothetical protein